MLRPPVESASVGSRSNLLFFCQQSAADCWLAVKSGSFREEFRLKSLLLSSLFVIGLAAHAKDSVVGCYSVLIAEPRAPSSKQSRSAHWVHGKNIRLTLEHVTTPWTGDSAFKVVPVVSSDKFDYRGAYWTLEKEDLSIIWSNNGLSGVQMTLSPATNGLKGVIEEFWDFMPSTNKRRVILTSRSC